MTDESLFEVGRNVATTEGAVVYENELFQLLEYKPLTTKVYERPFAGAALHQQVLHPDLQPDNSFIATRWSRAPHLVVSWRNPHEESWPTKPGTTMWEDGAMAAIDVVQSITGLTKSMPWALRGRHHPEQCPGGDGCARARARGQRHLPHHAHRLCRHRHSDVFIDEAFGSSELQMGKGGLMKGQRPASTFSFCAPMTWCGTTWWATTSGETPPPFDLLCWNSDSTNLPGPSTPGTCATSILKKPGSRASSPSVARAGPRAAHPARVHLRLARRPHRAHQRRVRVHPGAAWKKAWFVMGGLGPHRRCHQPACQEQTQPLDSRRRQAAPPSSNGLKATEHAGSWWTDLSHWLKGTSLANRLPPPRPMAREPSSRHRASSGSYSTKVLTCRLRECLGLPQSAW